MLKKYHFLIFLLISVLSINSIKAQQFDHNIFYNYLFQGEFSKSDSLISILPKNNRFRYYFTFLQSTYLKDHYGIYYNNKEIEKIKKEALNYIDNQIKIVSDKKILTELFFLKGCILSYSGIIAKQEGSFFKGINLAFSGVDALDEALELDNNYIDALIMRGIYNFYKAKSMHFIFSDKDEVIKRLLKYYQKSNYIKPLVANSLIIILRKENYFKEAYQISREVLKKYGSVRYFLRTTIKLDFLAKKYKKAQLQSYKLIDEVKNDSISLSFNLYKAYYNLAKASYLIKDKKDFNFAVNNIALIYLTNFELEKLGDRPKFLQEMKLEEYEE